MEKRFKAKQAQEAYVSKAREKYKGDCIRITSYTQQSTFAQGKDLERIQAKLKRAQLTVQANEKDFESFTNALVDLTPAWEVEWKSFCDTSQDLEEDRMDFMRDILWTYANHVSTVCVSDDEVSSYLDFLIPRASALIAMTIVLRADTDYSGRLRNRTGRHELRQGLRNRVPYTRNPTLRPFQRQRYSLGLIDCPGTPCHLRSRIEENGTGLPLVATSTGRTIATLQRACYPHSRS